MHCLRFSLILLLAVVYQSNGLEWNYGNEGPDVWSDDYPVCSGVSQSPIDINTAATMYLPFTEFKFSGGYNVIHNFTLNNNGHTVTAAYTGNDSSSFNFVGGGLVGTFTLSSFHMHWGENYKSGSEHQVNGNKYTSELHLIHINPVTNRIAVLGMFIQSQKDANVTQLTKRKRDTSTNQTSISTEWGRYLSAVGQLKQVNNSTVLSLNLASLFTNDTKSYWRYSGSLTTPPCTEGIIWTVFREPIIVSDQQFELLRNNLFTKDYRNPQRLYQRTVYRSFPNEALSASNSVFSLTNNYKTVIYLFVYSFIYLFIRK